MSNESLALMYHLSHSRLSIWCVFVYVFLCSVYSITEIDASYFPWSAFWSIITVNFVCQNWWFLLYSLLCVYHVHYCNCMNLCCWRPKMQWYKTQVLSHMKKSMLYDISILIRRFLLPDFWILYSAWLSIHRCHVHGTYHTFWWEFKHVLMDIRIKMIPKYHYGQLNESIDSFTWYGYDPFISLW